MRLIAYWEKTLKENIREWKILILALVFGPFFVYMMYAYFGAATPSYTLLVSDRDAAVRAADGRLLQAGKDLAAAWAAAKYPDGKPIFTVRPEAEPGEARRLLRNRDADLIIEIPAGLSRTLADLSSGKPGVVPPLKNVGDPASVRFMIAAAFADSISYAHLAAAMGKELPAFVEMEKAGTALPRSDFDLYVPALLVLAVIMVLFTAAASLIKEVDKGTITRLVLSKLTTFEFLGAITLNQVLIGLAALGLTYLSAVTVGYRGLGSPLLILLIGGVSTLSVVAVSLLVAAWMRTIYELLTVGVFPFFILMFFSESMFPLPRVALVRLAGRVLYVNDILPTSLTVKALNKVLNFGAGLGEVSFELTAMLVLTALYFAAGVWAFRRRHLNRRSR
jgi:ABC-2 type transport system permease protein